MVEIADIFRNYGFEYRCIHNLPYRMFKAMQAIETCRTADLGGHIDKCDSCGHIRISYNSCGNRHCPKCQGLKSEKWVMDRKDELLPTGYFHIVFTVTEELNPLILRNQKVMYEVLFKAASETLLELGEDTKHLGAQVGFIAVLHTWGQNLLDHPHIHCIVPGGGLSLNGKYWVRSRKKFLISVKVLSDLFKKKFNAYMIKKYYEGSLNFEGKLNKLSRKGSFEIFAHNLLNKDWVVYSKPPFSTAEKVVEYLGRYTHRVAISNNRIIKVEDGQVTFRYRDYKDNSRTKYMVLDANEFIRRFLLHVLPDNFVKIRYYGILSNKNKSTKLKKCQRLLGVFKKKISQKKIGFEELLMKIKGIDYRKCSHCNNGKLITIKEIEKKRYGPSLIRIPVSTI